MKKSLMLAAILAGGALPAHAADLSYTWIEGGYAQLNIDDDFLGDPEGKGGYVRGSYQLSSQAYVFGGYARVSEDYSYGGDRLDVDVDQTELGFGFRMEAGDNVDFTADIALVRLGADAEVRFANGDRFGLDDSTNAGRVTVGLRGTPSPRTEAWIKGGYLDGSDLDGEFVGTLGGQFKFNPTWGLVVEGEVTGDFTRYFAGVRASF